MNGAATGEAAARMINADNITSTINIGANQNFFRTFKKSQNSPIRDIIGFLPINEFMSYPVIIKTDRRTKIPV